MPGLRRIVALVVALLGAVALLVSGPASAGTPVDAGSRVLVTRIDGAITPVTVDLVRDGLANAGDGGYAAYVIELDTPGGLVSSTRDIVQAVLDSRVPVFVYIAPSGARAASAGTIITLSAHVAAMAPGTVIGAATPVDQSGEEAGQKAINDLAALAESLAELRGRDVTFAREAVTEARSVAVEEAVRIGAVDLAADSLSELLEAVDGQQVRVAGDRTVQLEVAGAAVHRADPGLVLQLRQLLADPNIAFLLLSLGTLGLLFELSSPGVGIGGSLGAVFLLLGLWSLAVLPVQITGVLLLLLALALLGAEVLAPGVGVFAVAGAIALVAGGLLLIEDVPGLGVSLATVLPLALVLAVAAVLVGRIAVTSRGRPSTSTGTGALIGRELTIDEPADANSTGRASLDGAWWSVRSAGKALSAGERARVQDVDGLTLVVAPLDAAAAVGDEQREGT